MRPGTTPNASAGFSIAEALVGLVLGLAVLSAVASVLVTQSRMYGLNRETVDARETLRGAAILLSSEIRQASLARGDLSFIGSSAIGVRSGKESGTVCRAAGGFYGIHSGAGQFPAEYGDSALVYNLNSKTWRRVTVTPVTATGAVCAWPGSLPVHAVVQIGAASPADTAGVTVGSPIRTFAHVRYGLRESDGRWWLFRRSSFDGVTRLVTGPLSPPDAGGLRFRYTDATGAVTTDPAQVSRIGMELRSESLKEVPASFSVGVLKDSLNLSVLIRN